MSESIAQLEGRMEEIADVLERMNGREDFTDDDQKKFDDLSAEFDGLKADRDALHRKAILDNVKANRNHATRGDRASANLDADPLGEPESNEYRAGSGNPWDLSEMRTYGRSRSEVASEFRARALDAVEKLKGSTDARRKVMTDFIENHDSEDGRIARLALATSHPDYVRAFAKASRFRENTQTVEERAAVERAMSLTDGEGGYLVPFQLDPTVIITSDGSLNQFRIPSRQVIATGDVWNGVSAGATSFSWDAEAAEVSDDASTFVQPTVSIHKGQGFVPISIEAMMDEQNVAGEVGRLLAFGKDTLESQAFATGSGSGQPFGIITAVTGEATSSATTDTFAVADVYALDEALPARYRPNASWFANRAIQNDIRQFDTSGGANLWERLANDVPPNLLGRPIYESEAMDGTINATQDNYVLVYGDFSNYVIADRVGLTVELVPHLFATGNNRPSGQRGWLAYFRVGADSVNDSAFELLNVT